MDWPLEPGEYEIGNPKKQVAVCTLGDDLKFPKGTVAIFGKNRTENLGVERIVVNLISNNNLRYLIVCGSEIKGHRSGQTLVSLSKCGIDKGRRVVNAEGAIPILQNIPDSFVERFRKQIKVVDMIGEVDERVILKKVSELNKMKTKPFKGAIDVKKYIMKPEVVMSKSLPTKKISISSEHNLALDPRTGRIRSK